MANVKGGMLANQKNEVANQAPQTLKSLIVSMQPQIEKALPAVITPERFTRMVLTALSTNPQLQQCSPKSFLGAMMTAAQLGVEPNTPLGQAYLIPYRNKGQLEAQFQLGYKGLIDLAYRSGSVVSISAHEVHENDLFEYELGLEEKLKHVPALKDRGPVILYYAVWHNKDGGHGFCVMSIEDIKNHMGKYSKAGGSQYSPWSTNFDAMAKKTVLKQALKYAPIKTDFVRAVGSDESIKTSIQAEMTDAPNEMEFVEAEVHEVEEVEPAPAE